MRVFIFSSIIIPSLALAAPNVQRISVGDGNVDGRRILAYEEIWKQCSLQDGAWVDGGTLTEQAIVIGEQLRHRQITARPDGIRSVATTYFTHASLAPLRMELAVTDPAGKPLASSVRELRADGYSGQVTRPGQEEQLVSGTISSGMYHGGVLGLPLATLDFANIDYELDASMMMFDAHYKVFATSAGTEKLEHNGDIFTTQLVDIEWHHDNGDIYPPGPDGSGGRFWLLADRSEDLPHVLRYKTDSYVIEFHSEYCP